MNIKPLSICPTTVTGIIVGKVKNGILNRFRLILPYLLIAVVIGLRLRGLSAMEFKSDENEVAGLIAQLGEVPWTFHAPVSANSGIAHSSGFYYFVHWLSLGTRSPLVMGRIIAGFNALVLALGIWLARNFNGRMLSLALMGTSAVLVGGSRKVWPPDLVQSWIILAIVLFETALTKSRGRSALIGLSGVCLVLAGHMYLPGALIAATGGAAILVCLYKQGELADFRAWLIGSALGWLTFVPYLYLVGTGAPEILAAPLGMHSGYDGELLTGVLKSVALGPSFFPFLADYLRRGWFGGEEIRLSGLYRLAWFWMVAGAVSLLGLYWWAVARLTVNWRAALRDPLAIAALLVLLVFPMGLIFSRLGSHLHYWLGVLPFQLYLIGFSYEVDSNETRRQEDRYFLRLSYICCFCGIMATLFFQQLVQLHGGLPGEYGLSYENPANPFSHGIVR